MIKSGFIQLHFSNGNIGNIRHRKVSKNSTLFKNNKMVFLYPFFPAYNNHSTPSCKKTRNKKRGNGSLLLCCV